MTPADLTSAHVVLARYRPGAHNEAGEVERTVHLIPVLDQSEADVVSAFCGALLTPEQIETVEPGTGAPCTPCLIYRSASPQPPPAGNVPPARPAPSHQRATPAGYRALGWPVVTRGDQVLLTLEEDVVALMVPVELAEGVATILAARHRPAPVLIHPYALDHRVFLAGERYGVELPWPAAVHLVTGTVLLPPTSTPRGPISWQHLPDEHALSLCREIDVFAAMRSATRPALDD